MVDLVMHVPTPDDDAVTHCVCGRPLKHPVHYTFPYNGGAKAAIATPKTDRHINNQYDAKEYLVQHGFTLEQAQAIIVAIDIISKRNGNIST